MSTTESKVTIHEEAIQELEMQCSPMDFLVVTAQLHDQLPRLHRRKTGTRWAIYWAYIPWLDLRVLYTEADGKFEICDVHAAVNTLADCVLPYDPAYDPVESSG